MTHTFWISLFAIITAPQLDPTEAGTTVNGCCSRSGPKNRILCQSGKPDMTQAECELEGCCYDDSMVSSKFCFKDDCAVITNNHNPKHGGYYGNWGRWGPWAHCPKGAYAVGIQTKLQMPQPRGGDDTALNGIKMHCRYPVAPAYQNYNSTVRQSTEGAYGSWGQVLQCPTGRWMYSFDLRVEGRQGPHGDDTAANSIRIYCTGTSGFLEDPRYTWSWGAWTGQRLCPHHHTICGIRTQVEEPHGVGVDDTSLNNVEFKCCL